MFAVNPLFILVVVAFVATVAGVTAVLITTAVTADQIGPALARARRHAVLASGLSLVALVAVPLVLVVLAAADVATDRGRLSEHDLMRLLAALPLLAVTVGLFVLLLGELTWPRPRGTSRTALLLERPPHLLLRTAWSTAAATVLAVTTAVLVVTGTLGDPGGTTLTHRYPGGLSTVGPFPGWAYAGPQLLCLAAASLLAALCVLAVTRRSSVEGVDPDVDLLLRRASVARVARAVVVGGLLTLGPDLAFTGLALAGVHQGSALVTVGHVLAVAGALLTLAGPFVLAVPVPRLSRVLGPATLAGPPHDPTRGVSIPGRSSSSGSTPAAGSWPA